MTGILIFFHCESNPGYAAASHEITFYKMAKRLVGSSENIHFAYRTLENGLSSTLPYDLTNIIEFDAMSKSHHHLSEVEGYIRKHDIQIAFGFDQPVRRRSHKYMRRGGVRYLVSYWGAPMSSINHGLKLLLKKLYVRTFPSRPNHFVFQSEGMRKTATHGQGVALADTSLVRTGINVEKFSPPSTPSYYAHEQFGIDSNKKIIFFSGHMEGRKGVDVIVRTAIHMVDEIGHRDLHFLLLGNKNGQEKKFQAMYEGTEAENHITFGGYRNDVPDLLKSCSAGFIASTVWDSFPMSSIEMAATGLPLVVSDLPGLREAVTEETGFRYPPSDHLSAASCLHSLLTDDTLRNRMGRKGRERAVAEFSVDQQISGLERIMRDVAAPVLAPKVESINPLPARQG